MSISFGQCRRVRRDEQVSRGSSDGASECVAVLVAWSADGDRYVAASEGALLGSEGAKHSGFIVIPNLRKLGTSSEYVLVLPGVVDFFCD